VHASGLLIALHEQLLIPLAKLGDALGQGIPTIFHFSAAHFLLGLDQHQVEIIAKIETLARSTAKKVDHFQPGDAARPGEEAPPGVELIEFLPQDEGSLLKQVIGIVEISRQGMNVAVQPGLNLAQTGSELGIPRE